MRCDKKTAERVGVEPAYTNPYLQWVSLESDFGSLKSPGIHSAKLIRESKRCFGEIRFMLNTLIRDAGQLQVASSLFVNLKY